MKSSIKSILIFSLLGPVIGLLVMFKGSLEALIHPFTLIPAFMFGGPVAVLTGAIFMTLKLITHKTLSVSFLSFWPGAIIGAVSGAIAANISIYFPVKMMQMANMYIFCAVIGAICGAICCIPIKFNTPQKTSN